MSMRLERNGRVIEVEMNIPFFIGQFKARPTKVSRNYVVVPVHVEGLKGKGAVRTLYIKSHKKSKLFKYIIDHKYTPNIKWNEYDLSGITVIKSKLTYRFFKDGSYDCQLYIQADDRREFAAPQYELEIFQTGSQKYLEIQEEDLSLKVNHSRSESINLNVADLDLLGFITLFRMTSTIEKKHITGYARLKCGFIELIGVLRKIEEVK